MSLTPTWWQQKNATCPAVRSGLVPSLTVAFQWILAMHSGLGMTFGVHEVNDRKQIPLILSTWWRGFEFNNKNEPIKLSVGEQVKATWRASLSRAEQGQRGPATMNRGVASSSNAVGGRMVSHITLSQITSMGNIHILGKCNSLCMIHLRIPSAKT